MLALVLTLVTTSLYICLITLIYFRGILTFSKAYYITSLGTLSYVLFMSIKTIWRSYGLFYISPLDLLGLKPIWLLDIIVYCRNSITLSHCFMVWQKMPKEIKKKNEPDKYIYMSWNIKDSWRMKIPAWSQCIGTIQENQEIFVKVHQIRVKSIFYSTSQKKKKNKRRMELIYEKEGKTEIKSQLRLV